MIQNTILFVLMGAVASLTVGSAVALRSARNRLKTDEVKPRTVATAIGELMIAWTGVGAAAGVFYLVILLVEELDSLVS